MVTDSGSGEQKSHPTGTPMATVPSVKKSRKWKNNMSDVRDRLESCLMSRWAMRRMCVEACSNGD